MGRSRMRVSTAVLNLRLVADLEITGATSSSNESNAGAVDKILFATFEQQFRTLQTHSHVRKSNQYFTTSQLAEVIFQPS